MDEARAAINNTASGAAALVARAEEPAILIDAEGRITASNTAAKPLAEAWQARNPELKGIVLSAGAGGAPSNGPVRIETETDADPQQRAFEAAVVPIGEGRLLVTARETSFEHNLTRALLRSRDLYKDLMECSSDFGWETDGEGRFTYVSPAGALGYTPQELNGRRASQYFYPRERGAPDPFTSGVVIKEAELEARDRMGERVLLSLSCLPVYDDGGACTAMRGVARDITREREREMQLKLDQARNALLARLALDIRGETETKEMVASAAESAACTLNARAAWSLCCGEDGPDGEAAHADTYHGGAKALQPLAERAHARAAAETREDAYMEIGYDGEDCLVAFAGAGHPVSCAMVFARDTAAQPWRAHEVELVHGIADHLAVALKQAEMMARLERLSRTDDLTGLLNRRALFEDMTARIGHQRRSGRFGCFLFIDLDHFKTLNDTLGHAAGDGVLKALGTLLARHSRVGDLAGRLGGDEFGLWLEDTEVEGGCRKAEALLAELETVREAGGTQACPLSMSIGVAPSDGSDALTAEALAERADAALYDAKSQGRGRIAVAEIALGASKTTETAG